jgi:hypothetical protein
MSWFDPGLGLLFLAAGILMAIFLRSEVMKRALDSCAG